MTSQIGFTTYEALPPGGRVHIVGAGPVGLFLAALLQSVPDVDVRLYEKRDAYTRSRMVQLAPSLVADSVESYSTDPIDGDNVQAVLDPSELNEVIEFRTSIPSDLMKLLRDWTQGFCPLKAIEQSLSDLIDARASKSVQRASAVVTALDAVAMLEPGDMLIDCTGSRSLLLDRLVPASDAAESAANTQLIHFENALVITFLYGQSYECNEYCKYYKNVENVHYKFIPSVHRTYLDGSVTHVTGIVTITDDEFAAMPPQFDGPWLRDDYPSVAESTASSTRSSRRRTAKSSASWRSCGSHSTCTGLAMRPADSGSPKGPFIIRSPVRRCSFSGDSAIGSPYFQSISLGFECAMFLAWLIAQRDLPPKDMLDRYELRVYKQWLRVYMRSTLIKHNKDLFQCVDDTDALLEKLHLY